MMKRIWLAVLSLTVVVIGTTGCLPGRDQAPFKEVPLVFTPALEMDLSIAVPTFTLKPIAVDPSDQAIPAATATETSSPERVPSQTHQVDTPDSDPEATYTPDPNLTCPPIVSDLDLEIPIANTGLFRKVEVFLDYLNRGGSPEKAIQAAREARQGTIEWVDLTGDGAPELALHLFFFMVYQCEQGQYLEVLRVSPMDLMAPPVAVIRDLNTNGIPELVVTTMFFGAHDGTLSMYVYEWGGQGFVSRLPEKIDHPYGDHAVAYMEHGSAHMYNGTVRFEDIDFNGTIEILLSGGGDDFYEDTIWMWNGEVFDLHKATQ
jgi:hypothetical protein